MRAAWDLLACSVHGCGRPLARTERALCCAASHSFDVARAGYVNLLQPTDRRSLAAGDAQEVVQARSALEERGFGLLLADRVGGLALRVASDASSVLDLGAGTGRHLAAVGRRLGCAVLGLDLSVHAVRMAARRHPEGAWCVANCDRVLPVRSDSVDLVQSIDARRPASEIARVLRPDGHVLVAVPGARDLMELREATLADARDLPGLERVQAGFAEQFVLVERCEVLERHELDARGLLDLALATYRAGRRSEGRRLEELAGLVVTSAHDVGLFARRGH